MELKSFICLGVLAAAMMLSSGCNNGIPREDNTLPGVPEASNDPEGAGYRDGSAMGRGNGFDKAGDWRANADDASVRGGAFGNGSADADGWKPADPSGNRLNMPIIYFAYDSDVLVSSETANLDRIAAYLNSHPELGLVIEGHCDQRGTEEYNRALGERRANAIRRYLTGKNVSDHRMKTVSYGKDKIQVPGNGESVWRQNRRGVPVPMVMPQR